MRYDNVDMESTALNNSQFHANAIVDPSVNWMHVLYQTIYKYSHPSSSSSLSNRYDSTEILDYLFVLIIYHSRHFL